MFLISLIFYFTRDKITVILLLFTCQNSGWFIFNTYSYLRGQVIKFLLNLRSGIRICETSLFQYVSFLNSLSIETQTSVYSLRLFDRLSEKISHICQDNALVHPDAVSIAKILELKFKLLSQPSDLTSNDTFLFQKAHWRKTHVESCKIVHFESEKLEETVGKMYRAKLNINYPKIKCYFIDLYELVHLPSYFM